MITGRRTSTDPVACSCGWRGELREAVHTYRRGLDGDSEPASECPVCGEEVEGSAPVPTRIRGAEGVVGQQKDGTFIVPLEKTA